MYNSPMAMANNVNLKCRKKHFKPIHVSDVAALKTLPKCVPCPAQVSTKVGTDSFFANSQDVVFTIFLCYVRVLGRCGSCSLWHACLSACTVDLHPPPNVAASNILHIFYE